MSDSTRWPATWSRAEALEYARNAGMVIHARVERDRLLCEHDGPRLAEPLLVANLRSPNYRPEDRSIVTCPSCVAWMNA